MAPPKLVFGRNLPPTTSFHSLREDPLIPLYRSLILVYPVAMAAALYWRVTSTLAAPSPLPATFSALLLLADVVLAICWVWSQPVRWCPVRRTEHTDRLPPRDEWPALDAFVCTADPKKEPPASTASTVLSLLALDYPSDRLTVYVSDDGGSDVTLLALIEAARFARHWLPFCTAKGVMRRSPEAFFACDNVGSPEAEEMKDMYEAMKANIDAAMAEGYVGRRLCSSDEYESTFKQWKGYTRDNHPTIIKVLLDSGRDRDVADQVLPSLVYVSREKSPSSPHHNKAGALNTLIRVSDVLTGAPAILTVDCDMHSTDPTSPARALCYILDRLMAPKLSYVQFPQRFQALNKSDIYDGSLKLILQINMRGFDGLRGPNFVGTNAFFTRRALLGLSPTSVEPGRAGRRSISSGDSNMAEAHRVASCHYERDTKWGSTTGFRYGSLVEDLYTGYRLHCEGWRSVFCDPAQPAFMGDTPKSLHDVLSQSKRWMVGLYEVAFSEHSPAVYGIRKAPFPVVLAYLNYCFWAIQCIPVAIYVIVPQIALISGMPLFPKASDTWIWLYGVLFSVAYLGDFAAYCFDGGNRAATSSLVRWWNAQRMSLIRCITAFPFGTAQYLLKQVGVSGQAFNVTSKVKEDEVEERYDRGLMEFSKVSPFFVMLGAAAVLNLTALAVGLLRRPPGEMAVHLFLAAFGVANSWPVYEAMFLRHDGGRMPANVTATSICLSSAIVAATWLTAGDM